MVAHRPPSASNAMLKMGVSSSANGVAAAPPCPLNFQIVPRLVPPETRKSPSGVSTIAIGPISVVLRVMPVAKARATKGLRTESNSLGALSGAAAGTSASACVNSALVEGSGVGAGGCPKLGAVVSGTVGTPPRLTLDPSEIALTPGLGTSRLPAMSVASARNS